MPQRYFVTVDVGTGLGYTRTDERRAHALYRKLCRDYPAVTVRLWVSFGGYAVIHTQRAA